MIQPFITVFTPTYNRAYTIDKLYQSLKRQTIKNFEWLVVDDGSTDNTKEVFEGWTHQDNGFPIRYVKVSNGGKHRAINQGVSLAEGKLFFIVDSDDYLTDDALEKIKLWETNLPKNAGLFAGVAGAKGYTANRMVGSGFPKQYIDAASQERLHYGITGDKAEVFYTDILKKFPFPAFEGENFITESVVWFKIGAAGYKIRWYNDIIYLCEYLPDGLTNNETSIFERNPKGYLVTIKSDLQNLRLPVIRRMAYYAMYRQIGRKLGLTEEQICKDLNLSKWTLTAAVILKKIKKAIAK